MFWAARALHWRDQRVSTVGGGVVATLLRLPTLPTLKRVGNHVNSLRDRDRALQLLPLNEEFPVSASHQLALITSLPFVHTARRYYRLNGLVRPSDWRPGRWQQQLGAEKLVKLGHLEEVKVVTRFP